MNLIESFRILEIEITKDERAIKNAYRQKLVMTNPEDDPEGFKRLRAAFETASQYAKRTSNVEETVPERDETLSGLWIEKVATLYANIKSRQDVNAWEVLFREDAFLFLEEEENCRLKMMRFLMDHFRLPTAIWELLDRKLAISKDMQQLKEIFPQNFLNYIQQKCEQGEGLDFTLFEGEEDAPYDQFIYYYEGCITAMSEGNLEQANKLLADADALHIMHPFHELSRARLAEKEGKIGEAVEKILALRSRYPENIAITFQAAELLWRNDRLEQASELYKVLKSWKEDHFFANIRLAEYYYDKQEYKKAKKCAEQLLSHGALPDFEELLKKIYVEVEKDLDREYEATGDAEVGLELCQCYLQNGKNSKGVRIALQLKNKLPHRKEYEYYEILTKLSAELFECEETLAWAELMEFSLREKIASGKSKNIEKDKKSIAQSYTIRLRMLCNMGYHNEVHWNTATRLYEGAKEDVKNETSVMLEAAKIYVETGEYDKCLELTGILIKERQVYAAHAISMDAYRRQFKADAVIRESRLCRQYFPEYARAYEFVAEIYLAWKSLEDLRQVLEQAKEHNLKSPILDAYAYQMENGLSNSDSIVQNFEESVKTHLNKLLEGNLSEYEEGLNILTEYLYMNPGASRLVNRGDYYRLAHKMEEAKADYEKAIVEAPGYFYSYKYLARIYRVTGQYEKALTAINKAIYFAEGNEEQFKYAELFTIRADIYSLMGDYEMARKSYEQYARRDASRNKFYMRRLARCQVHCGLQDEAIKTIRAAFRYDAFEMFEECAEIYMLCAPKEKVLRHLKEWRNWVVTFKESDKNFRVHYSAYCRMNAWTNFIFSTKKKTVTSFKHWIDNAQNIVEALRDGIIAAVLCGDEASARKWSAQLKMIIKSNYGTFNDSEILKKMDWAWRDDQKSRLQRDILCLYFDRTAEGIEALLDMEAEKDICFYCTYPLCRRLEGVRVMHLFHTGRKDEAIARVEKNLKVQPCDKFMLAARHMLIDNPKDPLEVFEEHIKNIFGLGGKN